ncbi:MAG: SIMPL domain-containing protein, partial [Nitrososphaeraceae archaeon]
MLFSSNNSTASAQQQQVQTSNPAQNNTANASTVSLKGTAATMVKPDKVTLSLGVETTNKTANAALAANSKIMNEVIRVLKAAGVKDNETNTSSFSISPNYNYSQQQPSDITGRRITGFTVSNTIQIESTNINNTSKWIDTAIAAGANTIDGIDFAVSNKKLEETKTNLIRQAMQDTRTKADILASAAGTKVVGVKSINLNDFAMQLPFPSSLPSA